jgi:hypothetical protein
MITVLKTGAGSMRASAAIKNGATHHASMASREAIYLAPPEHTKKRYKFQGNRINGRKISAP